MANINALKSQAAKLVVKGNFAKALGIYEKVKEMDSDEPGTYNLIGDVYLKMREKEKAIKEFKQALELYKKVQYYPNAIAVCKKIIRTDKEQSEVYKDLAGLYVERGFVAEAVVNFLEYSSKMRAEGDKKEEIEAYKKIIELGPSKIDIRERLVDLYIAEGEKEAAVEELEKIEELLIQQGKQAKLPKIEEKLAELKIEEMPGVVKEEKGKEEKELLVQQGFRMEDMMEGGVKVEEKVEVEKEKEKEKKIEAEEVEEEKIEKEEPEKDEAEEEVSFEEEIAKLQKSTDASSSGSVSVKNIPAPEKSELQSEPTQWTNFEELAQLCLSVNSKNEAVEYLYKAGQVCLNENNYEKAVKIFKNIIEINPLELRPRQKLIEISLKKENMDGVAEWNLDLGRCLYKKGAVGEAEKAFERALDATSGKKKIKMEIKKIKGKESIKEEEILEAPSISLGELLEEEEKKGVKFHIAEEQQVEEPVTFEDLLEEFKEGVLENIEDKDYSSHYDLGITYKEMGLLDEAVEEFRKASRGEKMGLKSIEMLALCMVEKGDFGEAVEVIKNGMSLDGHKDSEFLGLKYSLAQIYERTNKNEEAIELFRNIVKCDESFKEASAKLEELKERIKKQTTVPKKETEARKEKKKTGKRTEEKKDKSKEAEEKEAEKKKTEAKKEKEKEKEQEVKKKAEAKKEKDKLKVKPKRKKKKISFI